MRLVLALLMCMVAGLAFADEAPSAQDRADIQSAITQQLEAFKRNDAAAAFSQASPMIQQMFGTPEHFIAMVEHGYPPVFRPRGSRFGRILPDEEGQLVQSVELVGPDGGHYIALYRMEKQPDGSWKINGCELTESAPLDT
jgi:hypothetical protein